MQDVEWNQVIRGYKFYHILYYVYFNIQPKTNLIVEFELRVAKLKV